MGEVNALNLTPHQFLHYNKTLIKYHIMSPKVQTTTKDFNHPNYSAYCLTKPLNIQPTHFYIKTKSEYQLHKIKND